MFKKILTMGLLTLALAACNGGSDSKKIDTSSDQAFAQSVQEITQSLEQAKQAQFANALGMATAKAAMDAQGDPMKAQEKMKELLDGKTADDIIKEFGSN